MSHSQFPIQIDEHFPSAHYKYLFSKRTYTNSRNSRDTVRSLFELYCEVSPGEYVKEPYILRKYPESYKNEEELKNIPKFTFPCQLDSSSMSNVVNYSFVMTSVDSKYTFCFCRYDPKSNVALVLLSHLPWHDQFYKLLNCIANLLNSPERAELPSLLEACRIRPPLPGHTLKVAYNAGKSMFSCQSPDNRLPSIPENFNVTEYFSAMDSTCMAGLWAALLHERRVAIVATKLSRLSACVQAANATLFPMSWQHIFIPILPKHLVDYLLAPMPFLIGVPSTVMETVRKSEIGDVVILDLDANELRTPFKDLESLPSDMVSSLKKALSNKPAGDGVSRAFLRALVCLIGGYRDAIRIEKGQRITFNREAFIKTRRHMQAFLIKILQSQIFQQFIDERLELLNSGRGFSDEFEVECNFYAEKLGTGSGQRLKQQTADWAKIVKKEGGAFFKTVKDKANPAMQSAVKSVRQGGKNMKSAVKGLKNKMPKGSRPPSVDTMDESRYSCGSSSPVSTTSSESCPARAPREPPPPVPLDLLTEMEFLFRNTSPPHSDASFPEDARTVSPYVPPRLPERPKLPARYPIISTQRLVDVSEVPVPPPRANAHHHSPFVSNITKNDTSQTREFHTSTIRFTEGKDKSKLMLTVSNPRRTPALQALNGHSSKRSVLAPGARNGGIQPGEPLPRAPSRPRTPMSDHKQQTELPARAPLALALTPARQECCDSGFDLIKLEDSPNSLEEFDPLKRREGAQAQARAPSADSALLHEYGLDFSQFSLGDCATTATTSSAFTTLPKGWTTFN